MVHKHREILNNRNAVFSLCEASFEAQFKPDVTSFFVGWCIYENFRSLLPRPWDRLSGRNPSGLSICVNELADIVNLSPFLHYHRV